MTANASPSQLPPATRLTAIFAALLVMMLAVFAASPELHARLHAHEAAAAGTGHGVPLTSVDGDACAVALFSTGLLVAALFLLVIALLGPLLEFVWDTGLVISRSNPRYWLPPLCGPPLS